jgi:type II secretion system protein N
MIKLLKWVGYPLFGVLSFFIFLYMTFPYERAKAVVEDHLEAMLDAEVTIGDVGPSLFVGLTLSDVKITLRPKPPLPRFGAAPAPAEEPKKKKPQRIWLDEVSVNVGLLSAMFGSPSISFEVNGAVGHVEGEYEGSKKAGLFFETEVRDLRLQSLPVVAEKVGLPVRGKLGAKIKLAVPQNRWDKAHGAIELSCDSCSIGDGKAKLKVPGNAMLAMGIKMPRIRLGELSGRVTIEEGVAKIDELSARSPDIEVQGEGSVALRKPVSFSTVNAYLKFRISKELKKRDAKFELLENGLTQAKRSDGFFGMRLSGSLQRLRPFPSRLGPKESGGGGIGGRRPRGGPSLGPRPR